MREFPTVFIIAPLNSEAASYANSSNFVAAGKRPVCMSIERAAATLIGVRGCVIILVNCMDIGPEHSYRLENNIIIRTTF